MSTLAKQIADKARASGAIADKSKFFSVTDKNKVEVNGQMIDVEVPNGQHRVKILSQKIGKGKNFKGVEQDMLIMTVSDNGVEKLWDMPLKNEENKLYYLIEDIENIEIGEEFLVEAFKLQNGKYGKRITKVASNGAGDSGIPTVQYDEPASETDRPSLEESADISVEDIPF